MGALLAITQAFHWMKSFEYQIMSTNEIVNKLPKNDLEACPECNLRVTYKRKGVKCEKSDLVPTKTPKY